MFLFFKKNEQKKGELCIVAVNIFMLCIFCYHVFFFIALNNRSKKPLLHFHSLISLPSVNSVHFRSHQGFTPFPVKSIWLALTTAPAASSVHGPSKRLLQTPILLPITTEVISSKRDCVLLNLLINVTTTI